MSREWNWVLVISFTILHLSSSQQNSSAPRSVLASLPPSSEATTPPAVSSAPAASSEPNSSAASTAVPSPVPTTVPNTDYPVERCGPLYGNIWCPAGSMGQTLYCSKWVRRSNDVLRTSHVENNLLIGFLWRIIQS
uniref:CBM1 domain-containing protein n=1 Tax=Spongospora subterranea TaxID=70186 RepID=A0A0H5R3E1_9EUKA|eukprot:CRZ02499.1 hypothetical protein [Spongospora subterranea]